MGDLASHETSKWRQIAIHANVNDDHLRSHVAGEDVDGRPTTAKVLHHLSRHNLGVRAYSFTRHPMIRCKRENHLPLQCSWPPVNGHDLRGNRFQPPQAPARLGQGVEARSRPTHEVRIERVNP
jgi:hypothetical protein